jgi:predicted ATPase
LICVPRRKKLLDNREHVIEAAARLADAVLERSGEVAILATSREPSRVASGRDGRGETISPGRRLLREDAEPG